MKVIEYLKQEYDKLKTEHSYVKYELSRKYNEVINEIEEKRKQYNILSNIERDIILNECIHPICICHNNNRKVFYFAEMNPYIENCETEIYSIKEYNLLLQQLIELKTLLNTIKELIDNKPQYTSIKKEKLLIFGKYKNIKILDKLDYYKSSSTYESSLNGKISGKSFLGSGSIGGYLEGKQSGSSNAIYDNDILIEFTYDLDYELEDYMLDDIDVKKIIKSYKGE